MKLLKIIFVIIVLLITMITSNRYKNKHKLKYKLKNKDRPKKHKTRLITPGLDYEDEAMSDRDRDENGKYIKEQEEPEKSYEEKEEALNIDHRDHDFANIEDTSVHMTDWLTISSPTFRNQKKFPILETLEDGQQEISVHVPTFQRLNFFNFKLLPEEQRPPRKNIFHHPKNITLLRNNEELLKQEYFERKKDFFWFWFRASGRYMYYSSNPKILNQLGTFNLKNIAMARGVVSNVKCFEFQEKVSGSLYRVCALNEKTKLKWLCWLQDYIKAENKDGKCSHGAAKLPEYTEKEIIQPLMLIPRPSRSCNERWNYAQNGRDWECKCADGNIKF